MAGRPATAPAQSVPLLVDHIQRLEGDLSKVRAFGEKTHNQLQQERQAGQYRSLWYSWVHGLQPASGASQTHAGGTVSDSPSLRADHREVSLLAGQVEAGSAQAMGSTGAGGVEVSCCQTHSIPGIQLVQS